MSYDNMLYISVTPEYLEKCKMLTDTLLCSSPPILEVALGPCEAQIVAGKEHLYCSPTNVQTSHTLVTKVKPNAWIISAHQPIYDTVTCDGQNSPITITDNVRITLSWPCFTTIGGKKLLASHDIQSTAEEFVEFPMQNSIESSIIRREEPVKLIDVDLSDFDTLRARIEEHQNRIDQIGSHEGDTFTYYSLGTVGILATLILAFLFLKYGWKRYKVRIAASDQTYADTFPSSSGRESARGPINLRTIFQ